MPYIKVADLTLYYEEHGNAAGPPCVLLHGFTSTGASTWHNQLDAFGQSYRLIVPDWRGHGRTDNPAGASAMNHRQFARDITDFCLALALERPVLCGNSSGAMMLLSLAVQSPTLARALVLSACTHYFPEAMRISLREQTPDGALPERREMLQSLHTALGPDHWRKVLEAFYANFWRHDAEDFPVKEQLRQIQVPTLIIHGDRDNLFPIDVPAELYGLLPDAELCILPNTGHGVPRERPEWFNSIVLDFLARRVEPPSQEA